MSNTSTPELQQGRKPFKLRETATVRFAGDSGDGMQLVGGQFTSASVVFGNDISTLPDFPAEIRAPAGSIAGVSGFQVNFSSRDIYTPGDRVDALFVMNPAALKVNLPDLEKEGLLVVNTDAFTNENLERAGFKSNPLEDDSLKGYKVVAIPITTLNRAAVEGLGLDRKSQDRCKNFFTLGLAYWLYDRPLESTLGWIEKSMAKKPEVKEANIRTLKAGYNFGETTEIIPNTYKVNKAKIAPGAYRKITGNSAVALGAVAASRLSDKHLFYASYPITPASEILHELAAMKDYGVVTFQAEDEIAAICAAIGAAYGGALGMTGTSGPGLALKSEAIGLAVMTELPLVIVNVQRGGPSTGLPTKTEQSDLFQSLYGRNGECPAAVLAASTPSDCFEMTVEACRIALKYMTPVLLLTDGYLANGAEPWKLPKIDELQKIDVPFHTVPMEGGFKPYTRNERLSRPWAIPGAAGLEHRIGGLEKEHITGGVSYDPMNHDYMVRLRQEKVSGIAEEIPLQTVFGDPSGELLIVGWGSTYGAIQTAVEQARAKGKPVSYAHLRYLNPFPKNLKQILSSYKKVLVPEMNLGQLRFLLQGKFCIELIGLNKVQGKPFRVNEILEAINKNLES